MLKITNPKGNFFHRIFGAWSFLLKPYKVNEGTVDVTQKFAEKN
jgi:hypothetical protein